MALPVLPPPRSRLGSSPDTWAALGELRGELEALNVQLSQVAQGVASQTAGTRHQTLQLLIGGVVSCVVAVAGSRVVAPKPEATTTVIHRSTTDRALEACRAQFETEQARLDCIVRVIRDAAEKP
jgi:hypothetical protein